MYDGENNCYARKKANEGENKGYVRKNINDDFELKLSENKITKKGLPFWLGLVLLKVSKNERMGFNFRMLLFTQMILLIPKVNVHIAPT